MEQFTLIKYEEILLVHKIYKNCSDLGKDSYLPSSQVQPEIYMVSGPICVKQLKSDGST